ncbi:pyridoxamine 5'-phosphate oxidase-domain-containing protein [Ganoderma leucocontextum]|nr:pyridoxamine 5'-phosphate oxidase-domain-containing protein [Ganoderma leucocontextum]
MASTPRWLEAIKSALNHPNNKGKIIYQVATVEANGHPRVRSQVHRGFMEPDGHPELPIFVTSTDARAPKVNQAHSNQRVELAWWMEGSQDQFRISGFTHVFPSPAQGRPTPIPAEAAALTLLEKSGFDFEAKRKETFDKMSAAMRASWCTPYPPGTIISSYDEQKAWPGEVPLEQDAKTDQERKNIEVASNNFALMLFEPVQIDWVSLDNYPLKRVGFTRDGGKWIEHQVVP